MMRLELPMPLPSAANLREHWAVKAKRVKQQRQAVAFAMKAALRLQAVALPVAVTFIRSSPRPLDDDNLTSAFKGIRDEVARQLGITDAPTDTRAVWRYEQQRGPKGVVICVERRPT